MRLVQAAPLYTCFWGRPVERLLQWGFLTCFNCRFPSVSWRHWQRAVPWSWVHHWAGLEDGASLTQQTAQSSDQLFNRFSIWWRKLTYKNDRFYPGPTWNLSFWMDSSQRRTICRGCCGLDVGNLLLFKRFSIYPRLFSTSILSSSSCKTRLLSTFTRILLHLLPGH